MSHSIGERKPQLAMIKINKGLYIRGRKRQMLNRSLQTFKWAGFRLCKPKTDQLSVGIPHRKIAQLKIGRRALQNLHIFLLCPEPYRRKPTSITAGKSSIGQTLIYAQLHNHPSPRPFTAPFPVRDLRHFHIHCRAIESSQPGRIGTFKGNMVQISPSLHCSMIHSSPSLRHVIIFSQCKIFAINKTHQRLTGYTQMQRQGSLSHILCKPVPRQCGNLRLYPVQDVLIGILDEVFDQTCMRG